MKRLGINITLALLILGGIWWYLSPNYSLQNFVSQYVENGEFLTLEARYSAQQIMESKRKELLMDEQHTYLEPSLRFHPFLLIDVKYTSTDKKTKEGVILWSLNNGEMVLNTETWETTHGFEDAINAGATREDFKIINALARNNGMIGLDKLQKELHLERDVVESWIQNAKDKHLVIRKGNDIILHFQNPKILVSPQTKISHWLVTKPYNHAQRISRNYSSGQIERIAKAAFGSDFAIRNVTEVYLPVYQIDVLNPDGSIRSSSWNALTGQLMTPKYLMAS